MFDPTDFYRVRTPSEKMEDVFSSIRFMISREAKPRKEDIKKLFKGDNKCARNRYQNYFPQVLGGPCVGSGRADYHVIVAKKYHGQYGGIGTHTFCKECLDEYINKTGPYKKQGTVLESPDRKLFLYRR